MSSLVRSASLTGYVDLARSVGLDPPPLLAEAGLPAACLREPDLKVPVQAVRALLELTAERSGVANFGLRLAETRRLSNLGALGLLLREEPTLRGALQALMRFGRQHNEALLLKLEEVGGVVVLREELIVGQGRAVRQSTELVMGVTCRLLGVFLGPDWRPRRVCFAHAAPRDRSLHRRLFGDAVEFDHDFNGIVCSSADLDAPNLGADPVMARYARQLLEAIDSGGPPRVADEVRQQVLLLLPSGHCSVEQVARQLGVDRRTVHRQLTREGETFSGLVDALRRELAARHVQAGARPLADVAALLGFSAPSAFSRWYRQAFGQSAAQQRSDAAAAHVPFGLTGLRPVAPRPRRERDARGR